MGIEAAAVVGGGSLLGGLIGADATKDAANTQAGAAREATAEQRRQYDLTRQDQMPWMTRGNQAGDRLNYLLGLSANSGLPGGPLAPDRQTFLDQFEQERLASPGEAPYTRLNAADRAAFDAEVDRRYQAALRDFQAQQLPTAQSDPTFGSLMRNFGQSDLDNDVVYKSGLEFGLNEGTKGINRLMAAQGGLNSGATLKALTRFGNDYASTKANDSFNRFNTNKLNQFNMLSGVAGTGQTATNQVQAAGQNMANNVSNNIIGAGNARGASAIAQGNALTGAIGQGVNFYQQNQMMNRLFPGVAQQPGVTSWVSQG